MQSSSQSMQGSTSSIQQKYHLQVQKPASTTICNSLDSIIKRFGNGQNNSMPNLAENKPPQKGTIKCGKIYSVVSNFLQNNLEKVALLNSSKSLQLYATAKENSENDK